VQRDPVLEGQLADPVADGRPGCGCVGGSRAAFDIGFQLAPVGEAVLAGDAVLGVGELGARRLSANPLKPLLSFGLKALEVRLGRQGARGERP
jgi:hypothetical protein